MSKEAMKLALEALEEIHPGNMTPMAEEAWRKAIKVLREALTEQPAQQEPVAWMHEWEDGEKIPMLKGRDDRNQDKPKTVRPLVYGDTSTQPAQAGGETIVQTFTGLPRRKLRELLAAGWQINGVCFQRTEEDGTVRRGAATTGGMVLWWNTEQPAQRKTLTDEQPVSNADELPNGFVPLQKQNGKLVYAACMDSEARHYKWLMWRHPDGQWVSKRKLEDWEVMQVEDQQHYGIVQEAAHDIKEKNQ